MEIIFINQKLKKLFKDGYDKAVKQREAAIKQLVEQDSKGGDGVWKIRENEKNNNRG